MHDVSPITYCLNVHPSQSLAQVQAALCGPVHRVKERLSPDRPFPIGARFSAQAVQELQAPKARDELKQLLLAHELLPITVNGFPYGAFHDTPVKETVYLPDWRSEERLSYSCALAALMADLYPQGSMISLSTVPGAFRSDGESAHDIIADHYLRAAAFCAKLYDQTGVRVAIAIEPEPACLFETTEELADFFDRYLFSVQGVKRFAGYAGVSDSLAQDLLPKFIGGCFDVCHAAVEFEEPAQSFAALERVGAEIFKIQLSSALRIRSVDEEMRQELTAYNEPVYLHQVVSRDRHGGLHRYNDLGEALARGKASDGEEWRVHFHVPIFIEDAGPFSTTQSVLEDVLALCLKSAPAAHMEVETYTFDVLPKALQASCVEDNIVRELQWVHERLSV